MAAFIFWTWALRRATKSGYGLFGWHDEIEGLLGLLSSTHQLAMPVDPPPPPSPQYLPLVQLCVVYLQNLIQTPHYISGDFPKLARLILISFWKDYIWTPLHNTLKRQPKPNQQLFITQTHSWDFTAFTLSLD
jgi:hypothetical protein